MKSGIYKIRNIINGKLYIGSAAKISIRLIRHKCDLNKKRHDNILLQRAWNKYGSDAFEFKIIEVIIEPTKQKLIEREQFWIDWLKCVAPNGYNLRPIANNMLGFKHSEETKRKMSFVQKGRIVSKEARAKTSLANKGFKHTEETKKKMSAKRKGIKVHTDISRAKMSAWQIGRKMSKEARAKMSKAHSRPNKWPHEKGCRCKCEECREIRNKNERNKRNKFMPFIMVEANV